MLDAIIGAGAVLLSMGICLLLIRLQKNRPVEARGMAGLAATGAHLMLSLVFPAIAWVLRKPVYPLAFISSVLVFYWLSLIILVVAIIRWLRGAAAHLDTPELNSRQNKI